MKAAEITENAHFGGEAFAAGGRARGARKRSYQNQDPQCVVPGQAAALAPPGSLLEMQSLQLCPRPADPEALGWGHRCFNQPTGGPDAQSRLGATAL